MTKFNEDSRVKIPAILHLHRLGYEYLPLRNAKWDNHTNIFPDIFKTSIQNINPAIDEEEAERLLVETSLLLENEDLGKAFFEKLTNESGTKLINFDDFDSNSFHVVTELPCKSDDEEFRPDITILVNGMPLVFIEVKKPHNRDGIIAERERINKRFQNKKFRRFVNITQFMIFSNNMEYDDDDIEPLQGAFYASPSYHKPIFNYFREEENFDLQKILLPENDKLEDIVLKDNNLVVIKNSPEFLTNKSADSPTNRILTSLLHRDRLSFLLKYALTYVQQTSGYQKHIMRYPQIFATKAIEQRLEDGIRKGIIWHTQGSGKTALAYYNVRYLTDYFQKKRVVPKFYFIVDRLDLLTQAQREFNARGLIVHIVESKEDFVKSIRQTTALHNNSGKPEITVVNIQKFSEDSLVGTTKDYDINIQRIYFLDEVHRSYNPRGSFLANLTQSDKNAIKIGLTGTPLISSDYYSKDLFGDYIHKYYYNASIADGYTLRLIREEIESNYKLKMQEALERVEVLKGDFAKKDAFSHRRFAEPMLDYIIKDFKNTRLMLDDDTIGGMIICDSSEQAKMMFEIFNDKYNPNNIDSNSYREKGVAQVAETYSAKRTQSFAPESATIILHDVGSPQERKDWVANFKDGKIDLLFVYNMLLTGFDAPRLKKLYLGRIVRKHNLLQALTRVNRRYKDFKYGYVVDFADIRAEFDATNRAYFDELQSELGDDLQHYADIFKSTEEVEQDIKKIEETLFQFDTKNAEVFSQQIGKIKDRETILEIKKALTEAKSIYNLARLLGHYELLDRLDFKKLARLLIETENHLSLLNTQESLKNKSDNTNLLNLALEDIIFHFTKVKEEELVLADNLKDSLRKAREGLANNFDKKDPEFITLYDELKRLFDKKNMGDITQEEMVTNIGALKEIYAKIQELNNANNRLREVYDGDAKYTRIHKRIMERGGITQMESVLHGALMNVKNSADLQVLQNSRLIDNESYFKREMMKLVINEFRNNNNIKLNSEVSTFINTLVVNEYMNEFRGHAM